MTRTALALWLTPFLTAASFGCGPSVSALHVIPSPARDSLMGRTLSDAQVHIFVSGVPGNGGANAGRNLKNERDDLVAYLLQSEPLNESKASGNRAPYLGFSIGAIVIGVLGGTSVTLTKPDHSAKQVGEITSIVTGAIAAVVTLVGWDHTATQ